MTETELVNLLRRGGSSQGAAASRTVRTPERGILESHEVPPRRRHRGDLP